MAQVTSTGIIIDRQPDITLRVTGDWQTAFGSDFDVSSDSVARRLGDPIISRLTDLHELLLAVVEGTDEAQAQGVFLDSIGRLTGSARDIGSRSVGTLRITGVAGTLVRERFQVRNATTGVLFQTSEDATIPDTGAPVGTEVVDVPVQSVDIGAFPAAVGSLTELISVVTGVVSATNTVALTTGRAAQTDPEYRLSRRRSLVPSGLGTVGGVFNSVNAITNVQSVRVINNNTDAPVGGVPARSMRVVVFPTLTDPDDQQAVARAIAANQTGVTAWDGSEVFNVNTRSGVPITVRYSYAQSVFILVNAAVDTNSAFPSNGALLVRQQILKAFGGFPISPDENIQRFGVGDDVVVQRVLCDILLAVPGINSVTLTMGLKPTPPAVTTVIPIADGSVALIEDQGADITVTTT